MGSSTCPTCCRTPDGRGPYSGRHMDRGLGFEPRPRGSEPRILPLDHPRMERPPGLEPGPLAWKAAVLPLTPRTHGSGDGDRTRLRGLMKPTSSLEQTPHGTQMRNRTPLSRLIRSVSTTSGPSVHGWKAWIRTRTTRLTAEHAAVEHHSPMVTREGFEPPSSRLRAGSIAGYANEPCGPSGSTPSSGAHPEGL